MIRRALAIIFIALFYWPTVTYAAEREQTRETMQRIFETLRGMLPLSVDEARFRAPILEPNIRQSLRLLSEQTAALSEHVANSDIGFEYLGRSLASYTADASRHYDARRYENAQVLIQHMTNVCIACHSRLPSPGDSPLAEGFVSQSQIAKLPLEQRAELQAATRQFDAAIHTYEQIFADPSIHPADIIGGPLTDYLILCIRVKGDLSRPVPTLKAFTRRPKLWRSMQDDIGHWIDSLQTLRDEPNQPATLKKGRALIDAAFTPDTYPIDRRPLVQYIAASSVLNRFIKAQDPKSSRTPEVAEAYYLLGLTEYRIDRDYWVSQADHYLEAAIRMAA